MSERVRKGGWGSVCLSTVCVFFLVSICLSVSASEIREMYKTVHKYILGQYLGDRFVNFHQK